MLARLLGISPTRALPQDPDGRWRAVFENSAVGVGLTDVAGRVISANPALQKMLGYTEEELRGRSLIEMPSDEETIAARCRITGLLEGLYSEYHVLRRYLRKDGSLVWGNTSLSLVLDTQAEPLMLVAVVENVTDRKLAEQALADSQADLARVIRATTMGELAASIAHEVNQPLAAVMANGQACLRWLAMQPPNLEEANAAVRRIVRDADRASDVIVRIRAFLRRGESRMAPVDIEEVLREAMSLVRDRAEHYKVSVRYAIERGLPPVLGERVQLHQVCVNLAMNAIESLQATTGRERVLALSAQREGPRAVVVCVSDTGVGLGAANRDRIFDAFYTTKSDGMGMGLAISRSIVEAHGGEIYAVPQEGGGERFCFTLPVAP